jgi:DNA-binding transcriptional MerR regulator
MTRKYYPTVGIGEASRITGVSEKKLRSWEGKFIPMPQKIRSGNYGYRRYTESDIALIRKIKQYQDEGYTIKAASTKAAKDNSTKN